MKEWWKQNGNGVFGEMSGAGDSSRITPRESLVNGAGKASSGGVVVEDLSPAIPNLKRQEKEKERKGGAIPWFRLGSGSEGIVVGARVTGVSTQWGFLGSARIASLLARSFGTSTWLGGFFASGFGSSLVLCGMLSVVMLAGLAGLRWTDLWLGRSKESMKLPALGGIDTSVRAKKAKDVSLNYLARANQGQIKFDSPTPPPAAPQKKEEVKAPEPRDAMGPTAKGLESLQQQLMQKLKANGLNDRLGNLLAGRFGGGSNSNLNSALTSSLNSSLSMGKQNPFGPNDNLKKLKPFPVAAKAYSSTPRTLKRARAGRAMGQLKFANYASNAGLGAGSNETSASYESGAFEQNLGQGGQVEGIGVGSGVVSPVGSGAPTDGTGISGGAPSAGGANSTPYQNLLDAAKGLGSGSSMMKILGMLMMAAGAMMILKAAGLMGNPSTMGLGKAIYAIAIGIMMMGAMMLMMSSNFAGMGKNLGNVIGNQYGQQDQGQIVNECMDQAANGTNPANCQPTTQIPPPSNTVQEAVQAESSADYSMEEAGTGQ